MRRVLTNRCRVPLAVVVWLAVLLSPPTVTVGQAQTVSAVSGADASGAWDSIAEKVTLLAKKAGCDDENCKILVADCITTSDSSSFYGRRISDEFSDALTKLLGPAQVVNRGVLKQFLVQQRIPSKSFSEVGAARWLGKKLDATFVILPILISYSLGSQVLFKLARVDPELIVVPDEMRVPLAPPSPADLQATEQFASIPPPNAADGSEIEYGTDHRAGPPSCNSTPQPSYTDDARAAKISGTILVDAIVMQDGAVKNPRILQGLPCGLNESMLAAVKTWRCEPALLDGKPVAVRVPLEATFSISY
jgi:TonB family protein